MGEGKECNDAAPAVERRCGIATGEVYGRRRGRGKFQLQLGERRQWRRAGEWEQAQGVAATGWTAPSSARRGGWAHQLVPVWVPVRVRVPVLYCSTRSAVQYLRMSTCALLPVPRRYRLTAAHAWAGQRQGIDRAPAGWRPAEEVPGARGSGSEVRVLAPRAANVPARGPRLAEAFQRCSGDGQQSSPPRNRPAALHTGIGLTDDSQRPLLD